MFTHSKAVPLRTHKKSRGGCKSCKERRVKCDEIRPVCGKCAVHFLNVKACDWTPPTSKVKKRLGGNDLVFPKPRSIAVKEEVEQIVGRNEPEPEKVSKGNCKLHCPCHDPKYTALLLDAVFKICRVCGNQPWKTTSATECNPTLHSSLLVSGKIDPFGILPSLCTAEDHKLVCHFVTSLSILPTSIHSQYCTNPLWLTTAIANPTLFNTTLYVCSTHLDGQNQRRDTTEALWYKNKTIRLLNNSLREEGQKREVSDETIAAVILLTHVLAVVGSSSEVDAHIDGIKLMVKLRGGIEKVAWNSMLLHMLCTTNHITAVLSDDLFISSQPTTSPPQYVETRRHAVAENFQQFAARIGFHETMVALLERMAFLYGVVDVFTQKFLPAYRNEFVEKFARC